LREGILGGSFDPIHNGHLHVAAECRRRLALERVVFIPARVPPHKPSSLTGAAHRLEMVKLAVDGLPGFEVSDVELRRKGPSYTVDTVSADRERLGEGSEIFFLIGADQAFELHTWYRIATLAKLCTLVTVTRSGFRLDALDRLREKLPAEIVEALKASALGIPPMDISATDIRRRVREGKSIADLVPPAVEEYIRREGLYR
jgi:nicotinate-nucleotide adenylyltransferase